MSDGDVYCSNSNAGGVRGASCCFFSPLSVRKMCDCYLTSRYPPILLNNVRLQKDMCWFVIRTDKLISSVQVGLAGSLHDYVTLLQVHNFFFFFHDDIFFSPYQCHFFEKKKNMTRTVRSVRCHAYQIVCSALTFFVSQVKAVKYIQWMIFNSLSTPCSAV